MLARLHKDIDILDAEPDQCRVIGSNIERGNEEATRLSFDETPIIIESCEISQCYGLPRAANLGSLAADVGGSWVCRRRAALPLTAA